MVWFKTGRMTAIFLPLENNYKTEKDPIICKIIRRIQSLKAFISYLKPQTQPLSQNFIQNQKQLITVICKQQLCNLRKQSYTNVTKKVKLKNLFGNTKIYTRNFSDTNTKNLYHYNALSPVWKRQLTWLLLILVHNEDFNVGKFLDEILVGAISGQHGIHNVRYPLYSQNVVISYVK